MIETAALKNNGVPTTAARRKSTTAQDVARVVGVSQVTVSHVLNGKGRVSAEMRAKVQAVAQEMGYEPNPYAQKLANGGCDDTIGLFSLSLDVGMGTRTIHAIQRRLHERGYSAPLHAYDRLVAYQMPGRAKLLADLRRQKPRAIVCHTCGLTPEALDELRRYHDEGGLVVTYDVPANLPCDQVIFDLAEGVYHAARHLVELGHRRIGLCSFLPRRASDEHLKQFARALKKGGCSRREEWLFFRQDNELIDLEETGVRLAERFLALDPAKRPTALCAYPDATAIPLIGALERAGVRVPQDVSVSGHDDIPLARYGNPQLTTFSRPIEAIAERVVELLDERLRGDESPPRREIVAGELQVRRSTGPPPD